MGKFREHTLEEKRKLRNARQQRKRKQRMMQRQNINKAEDLKKYEEQKQLTGKIRETAREFCRKWRGKCIENKKLRELLVKRKGKVIQNKQTLITENRANNISASELVSKEKLNCLGEGSYGKCYLKKHTRLGIFVVEKQMPDAGVPDVLKEVQIMQILVHPNIPTVLGIQSEKKPFSVVMEFIGEANSSVTAHKLIHSTCKLDKKEWIKIVYNVADALNHMHKKGFLHCDLKSNNIVVSSNKGYLIDFGKACSIASPTCKKYTSSYPHIAPEVLHGSPCTTHSDIYSLGTVFSKIGLSKDIDVISNIGKDCLNINPFRRPTLLGILASLATQI